MAKPQWESRHTEIAKKFEAKKKNGELGKAISFKDPKDFIKSLNV